MSFLSPPTPPPIVMPTPSPVAQAPSAPIGTKPQAKAAQPTFLGALASGASPANTGQKTLLGT